MDGTETLAGALKRELAALLSDEVVRELVRPRRASRLASFLAGLVL